MWTKIKTYVKQLNSDSFLEERIRHNREALERKREAYRLEQKEGPEVGPGPTPLERPV